MVTVQDPIFQKAVPIAGKINEVANRPKERGFKASAVSSK